MVFFVGILPALVTLWIQKGVPESEMWRAHRAKTVALADGEATLGQPIRAVEPGFIRIFQPPFAKHTFALLFMNFFGMFAWWGLFTWMMRMKAEIGRAHV